MRQEGEEPGEGAHKDLSQQRERSHLPVLGKGRKAGQAGGGVFTLLWPSPFPGLEGADQVLLLGWCLSPSVAGGSVPAHQRPPKECLRGQALATDATPHKPTDHFVRLPGEPLASRPRLPEEAPQHHLTT